MASVVFTTVNSRFAEPGSISLVLQQAAIIACLAIGQTLIILTAGIDLSVGAIMVLSMMVAATITAENGVPAPLAILVGVAVGTACGILNGLLVTKLKLPPFITTLGTLSIFTALVLLYTKGKSVQASDMPDFMLWTGNVIKFGDFTITYGIVIVVLLYLGREPTTRKIAPKMLSFERVLVLRWNVCGIFGFRTITQVCGRGNGRT